MRRFNDPEVPNELAHRIQLRGIAERAAHTASVHSED